MTTTQNLIQEVDRLSAEIRELFMDEQDARLVKNHEEAERLKRERIKLEAKYGEAYKAYVSGRPEVVDVPRSTLWHQWHVRGAS